MNCQNCGTPVSDGTKFCPNCGTELTQQNIQPQQVQSQQMQPQQMPQQQAVGVKVKKKRTGLKVFLIILAVVVLIVGALFVLKNTIRGFKLFGPKDLGVRYTQQNYEDALEKTGVDIDFAGMSKKELEAFKKDRKNWDLDYQDFDWEFSDYERITIVLTKEEATAFLNEIAPGFFWFDNIQVRVNPDGSMEGSSTVNVLKFVQDLFPEDAQDLDLLPEDIRDTVLKFLTSLNIYSKGELSVKDNKLTANPEVFTAGPVDVLQFVDTGDGIYEMENMFSEIYKKIPGLVIYSLDVDSSGNFVFDGLVPQKIKVEPKTP